MAKFTVSLSRREFYEVEVEAATEDAAREIASATVYASPGSYYVSSDNCVVEEVRSGWDSDPVDPLTRMTSLEVCQWWIENGRKS
jgi:hypothetical protein